jgi:hypothetical protein
VLPRGLKIAMSLSRSRAQAELNDEDAKINSRVGPAGRVLIHGLNPLKPAQLSLWTYVAYLSECFWEVCAETRSSFPGSRQ